MVFVFIAIGVIFGAGAAAFTLMSGGSVLLALLAYSVAGSLATMAVIAVLYFIDDDESEPDGVWRELQDPVNPASA